MPSFRDIQTDEWWQDVTTPMLETVRKRLRALVKLIEKQARKPIYTDFEDLMGNETSVELPGFVRPDGFERFRAKARAFLREHEDHLTIHKLRMNRPLTPTDLDELEECSLRAESALHDHLQRAKTEAKASGLFVRSLVGLDREAAKQAFAGFLTGKTLGRESDRVRESDHRSPHGTRRHGSGTTLRVAVHRCEPSGTRRGFQSKAGG